jgi:hypothetical protein
VVVVEGARRGWREEEVEGREEGRRARLVAPLVPASARLVLGWVPLLLLLLPPPSPAAEQLPPRAIIAAFGFGERGVGVRLLFFLLLPRRARVRSLCCFQDQRSVGSRRRGG